MGISLAALAACGSDAPASVDPTDPGGDPQDRPDVPAPDPAAEGPATYEVVSTFDVPVSALLPEPASEAVGTLADFRASPASTLFTILDEAGVPGAAELQDAMPGPVEDELNDFIDESIEGAEVNGTPATQHLDFVLDQTELVLGRFDLVTDLTLAHDGDDLAATHRVRALRIPAGAPLELELPEDRALDAIFTLETTPSAEVEKTTLTLGDHTFGLPYGELAWMALDLALHEAYGTDLRGVLGTIVDCSAVAAEVADQCVLGVCVGHEAELADLCAQGLDLIAAKVQDEVTSMRFDAVHLQAGRATLEDAGQDGQADALVNGVWQAELDLGQGPRACGATFTGTRE